MSRILIFVILYAFSFLSCVKENPISYQAQLKKDTESISEYVSVTNPDAKKVGSGIWYSIDALSNGIYPTPSDEVMIRYKLKLIPDQSTKPEAELDTLGHSKLSTLILSKAISGLQQGLILFPANSLGRIYIPSGLAYGMNTHIDEAKDTSYVSIPANANLLYEIELISVKSTKFASDTAAIANFLQANGISPVPLRDGSGIRYTIDTTKHTSTNKPKPEDSILISYSENFLTTVDTAKVYTKKFEWKDQVTAWRIMLPEYITEGSTITMYVPSGYAHGSSTISSTGATIPQNSNMIYKITLIEINPQ